MRKWGKIIWKSKVRRRIHREGKVNGRDENTLIDGQIVSGVVYQLAYHTDPQCQLAATGS